MLKGNFIPRMPNTPTNIVTTGKKRIDINKNKCEWQKGFIIYGSGPWHRWGMQRCVYTRPGWYVGFPGLLYTALSSPEQRHRIHGEHAALG
jgi:hypothetical protein